MFPYLYANANHKMKAATSKQIKDFLQQLPAQELLALCLRLVRFKKDNKELLTYLLFHSVDEATYVQDLKDYIGGEFVQINDRSDYLAKKSMRRIIKTVNKFLKYSDEKTTSVEVLLCLCAELKVQALHFKNSVVIGNMYSAVITKIQNQINTLHQDLQFDYEKQLKEII